MTDLLNTIAGPLGGALVTLAGGGLLYGKRTLKAARDVLWRHRKELVQEITQRTDITIGGDTEVSVTNTAPVGHAEELTQLVVPSAPSQEDLEATVRTVMNDMVKSLYEEIARLRAEVKDLSARVDAGGQRETELLRQLDEKKHQLTLLRKVLADNNLPDPTLQESA